MTNVHADAFYENPDVYIHQAVTLNQPVSVATPKGNAAIVNEEYLRGLEETLYLSSIPNLKSEVLKSMKTPREDLKTLDFNSFEEFKEVIIHSAWSHYE